MARPFDKPESDKTTAESEGKAEGPGETRGEAPDAKAVAGKDAGAEASKSAVAERMKSQHKALQAILDKRGEPSADPGTIAREFAAAWLPHMLIEREALRAARGAGETGDAVARAEIRRDLLNLLLANLLEGGPRGAGRPALEALAEQFSALMQKGRREEAGAAQAIDALLASGRMSMSDIERRYQRAQQTFENLDDDAIGEAIDLLAPRRLSVHAERQPSERERHMSRYSQGRERDEQGRFMPDDERGYGRGGGYRSMPQRDEGGRFVSDDERRMRGRYEEDDDRSRYGRSMGRGYDEDERRFGGGRGQSGWFGDPEGHSEASRRGWENPDHGRSGWYGDREGHSEASRRGWESSDHGRSGWYGDPEGHSEASRRGWDEGHRMQRRDEGDNGRYGGRRYEAGRYESEGRRGSGGYESQRGGRYEEDDERYGSHGHGGWSGDPEGHSEASRRGWENRRR